MIRWRSLCLDVIVLSDPAMHAQATPNRNVISLSFVVLEKSREDGCQYSSAKWNAIQAPIPS